MFFDFVGGIVADHVKSFEMICEKYFEVVVVGIVMEDGVDVVIVCAGIGGIFYFKIFNKDKVFDDFDCLDFPISAEEVPN